MHLEPVSSLHWAYQLHYYLCFRTHRRRPSLASEAQKEFFTATLDEIANRHGYHILQSKAYADHVRCLVSLRPDQPIAEVIKTVKVNFAREYNIQFAETPPFWARGYLARSVGRVQLGAVRQYLDRQAEHHGYAKRIRPPTFRFKVQSPTPLTAAHATFELSHHLVFSTRYRAGVFSSEIGAALTQYWLNVAAKRDFAIDRISILPDHIHLIVRTVPKLNIESCALSLLNNGQYFVGKHYPQALINAGIDKLWQDSAYAGACGEVTTAVVKSFLGRPE